MSFRNPFVTDFIYQASDEVRGANAGLTEVFERYSRRLAHKVDERGYGYYAGFFSTLDGSLDDMGLREIEHELGKATKVGFRLAILTESGPALILEIRPEKS